MSAASRKKHSNTHKGFQAGDDQLEVSSLIAGASNGRDIEQKGLDLQRSIETSLAASNVTDFEVIDDTAPQQANISIVLDEHGQPPKQPKSVLTVSGGGRIAQAIADSFDTNQERAELDLTSNPPHGYVPSHIDESAGTPVATEETRSNKYVGQDIRAYVVRIGSKLEGELADTIVAMIELHAERINGLRTGFTVGQYTNTQRRAMMTGSEARINLQELQGRPFDRALHAWADRYNDYQAASERKMPASHQKLEVDDVTIDVLFIEPDSTGTLVHSAWLGSYLYVSSYSGLESYKVEAGDSHCSQGIRFDLSGEYKRNVLVDKQAQDKLDSLSTAPWVEQEA
jgi:hypothetical protein